MNVLPTYSPDPIYNYIILALIFLMAIKTVIIVLWLLHDETKTSAHNEHDYGQSPDSQPVAKSWDYPGDLP